MHLLRISYQPEDFNHELEFRSFTGRDFGTNAITNGVSFFLYRVFPNGVHRTPAGRIGPDGQRLQTRLPIELHFLLTIWAREASLQHTLVGWVMRTLEDTPILTPGLLNSVIPDSAVFGPEETVEVALAELRTEDLLRIWEVLGLNVYQLSIPYLARIINLDSVQPRLSGDVFQEIQIRRQTVGVLEDRQKES